MAENKFMNRYNNNPEFKINHLMYINEKILCHNCGVAETSRCNMAKHQRTSKCMKVCARRVDRVKAILLDEDDTDEIKNEKIRNYILNVQP
jgi:hypothetical protein